MKVLVFGATGTVGSEVVKELQKRGAEVRAFVRGESSAKRLPSGVEAAEGDLLDPQSIQTALQGVDKVFLLNAVTPDELTQAIFVYTLAKKAGVKHLTYLSLFRPEQSRDVPHIAAKLAMEALIREQGVPFTILRPGSFFQNDAALKDLLLGPGIYPSPLGDVPLAAIDARDIGEAAAISLTEEGHVGQTYNLVGPTLLTGEDTAAIWSSLLGKPVQYQRVELNAWQEQMRSLIPAWMSYSLRLMMEGVIERGLTATPVQVAQLEKVLGHTPRSYESFATDLAAAWKEAAK